MRQLLTVIALAVLVALALWFQLPDDAADSGPVLPDAGPELTLDAGRTAPSGLGAAVPEAASPTPAASERTELELGTAAARGPEDRPEAPPEGRARVRGRFLLPGGVPAAGVAVRLRGHAANTERVLQHGLPDDWQDLTATTGPAGRFELRLDPPQAYQFFLDASLTGYATESWRWSRLGLDEDRDLGPVTLREAGSIEGRLLDAAGDPMQQPWRIYAQGPAGAAGGDGRDATSVSVPYDPAVGRFRLEGLPAGPVALSAHSRLAGWIDGPQVQVRRGETVEADMLYAGPDLSRRIEVVTFTNPFYILSGTDERVHLSGPGFEADTERTPRSSQSYAFDDLAPGEYTVTVEHDLFEPFVAHGVQPGQRINADLVPSAHLVLRIEDAATGAPVNTARLQLRLDDYARYSPNAFELHSGELPADGLLPPVVPGDTTLLIEAEGYAVYELPIEGLAAYETRELVARLAPAAQLGGRVLDAAGRPAAGIQVLLMGPGESPAIGQVWDTGGGQRTRGAVDEVRTAPDGRFTFPGLAPGTYDVHAAATPWRLASRRDVVVAPGAPVDLGLTLPTGAGLRLTLADLATPPAGFEVALVTAAKPLAKLEAWPDLGPHGAARVPLVPTDTGTWLGLDLPPGPARLVLGRGTVELPHAGGSSFAYGETRQLAELDLEAGRTLELELELGELQPGELLVEVLADGLPLPGLRVQVQSFAGFGGTTLTGPLGFGEVDGLFPGEFVVKVVRPGVGEFRAAGQVTIRGGERSQVRIDATVVAGAVLVQGPDGAPLADASVRLTGGSLSSYVETDDEGRLEASLVPGVVQVSYREFDPSAGEWVDLVGELSWPAPGSAGQVRLLPK